jgi:hypothetical protein
MRRFMSAVAVAVAVAIGGGAAAIPTTALARSCPSWDVHAVIGGSQKCLGAGEFCAVRYNREYHRYGFNCVLYPSGYHHLKRRR